MLTQSYVNTDAISPKTCQNPSLLPENRINLHPDELQVIENALFTQMAKTILTSYEQRILLAIHNQTLGYDKFEDDMNGTRLEQLTGIRNDHANTTVRSLQEKNVIITRCGTYGHWMSINFDLAHWGTAYFGINNNNPRILLPADDKENPIDSGFSLSSPREEADEKQIPALANINNKTNNTITATTDNQQIVAKNDTESKDEEKIENKIEIKDKINNTMIATTDNQQTVTKNATESKDEEKIENKIEIKDKTNKTMIATTDNQQTVTKNDTESKDEEKIENEIEIKDKKKIESEVKIKKKEKTKNEAKEDPQQENMVLVFEYPSVLPIKLQYQLEPLLRNMDDLQQAQGLLNYFAQCFINTTIHKPLIYFKKLLTLLKKGLLFLTDSDKESPEKKQEKQKEKQRLIDQRLAYNAAWADYQHIKAMIEAEAKDAQCDFDTYLKTSPYQSLWQSVVDKLESFIPLQSLDTATG